MEKKEGLKEELQAMKQLAASLLVFVAGFFTVVGIIATLTMEIPWSIKIGFAVFELIVTVFFSIVIRRVWKKGWREIEELINKL